MSGSRRAPLSNATDGDVATAIALQPAGSADAAEEELYRRFAPRVRLYGLKHLRDEMAAQDLAQQVLLMTIERLRAGEVRNIEQIGSFILGASRMMCGAHHRIEQRRRDLHARFDTGDHADERGMPDVFGVENVARCLATIRERDRMILVLTFYAERPTDDIAATLGVSAGAVRVSRHRALELMRTCLEAKRLS